MTAPESTEDTAMSTPEERMRAAGIDWAGLSWRRLRGWFRGTQCLADCGSGHQYGSRWCLL